MGARWANYGLGLATVLTAIPAAAQPSHLMRHADVHHDQVVFTYEGDLWLASTSGGAARRITSDDGEELYAKFSPDGAKLAFTGGYDGGSDVYVMDAAGGAPERLTYHPASDRVLDWTPDGRYVLFRSRREYPFRAERVYKISVEGGMPEPLPVDRAGLASLSPDGTSIAYNRITREDRTWKRHQGGTAQDIWAGRLDRGDFKKITDWAGTDNFPMWSGDSIYFTSDRNHGTLNLFKCDPSGANVAALTDYSDYDVKYPSLGPGVIVYQYGESLHLLDLATGESSPVDVTMPSDRTEMRPSYISVGDSIRSFALSPHGKSMLLEARGEIVTLPAEEGQAVNLTRTSGSRDKDPAWSPDGKWVAFLSDAAGEEEVYLIDPKGDQPPRQLTRGGLGYRMRPVWSPDSKYLMFADKFLRLNLVDAESGTVTQVDRGEYDDSWYRWGIQDYVWSPDSRWIAYTKMEESGYDSIFLYHLADRTVHRVTSEMTSDFSPSFDPKGRYLYFLSNRTFKPVMGMIDQNHVFLDVCRPYVLILKEGEPSPFAPEDSGEGAKHDDADDSDDKDEDNAETHAKDADAKDDEAEAKDDGESGDDEKDKKKETQIDLGDFERRIVAVEGVSPGNYFRLEGTDKGFLYLAKTEHEFLKYQMVDDTTSGKLDLHAYDLKEKKDKQVLAGINNYHLSADGKKLVYRAGETFGVVDTGKEAKAGDGKVDLGRVTVKIDPREEFTQIFNESWRVQRDWFYDPGMHGLDWAATGEKYRRFLPDCGNRSDLNYLIGEMIGELNVGHTYISGGQVRREGHTIRTGLLGAEFETPPSAAYHKIVHIVPGTPWDDEARSPLAAPGCPIKEGDYLIAIDGRDAPSADNVYKWLEHKANAIVTITYNDKPAAEGAKTYMVKTVGSESGARYREWVESNRAMVDRASGGRIGYLHIPNMMDEGLSEFAKVFFPHHYKSGFIIDVRYNGGGFTGDMIIDRLERRIWAQSKPREGNPLRDPDRVFHGHLAVLINQDTGSNGEYFAEAVKIKRLATLIGTRTWGGAIGIELHQPLVDKGQTTPPQFAPYSLQRAWLIEGHGVDPDIDVQNMPGDVLEGKDTQLKTAIDYLLRKVDAEPMPLPSPPPYPIKRK